MNFAKPHSSYSSPGRRNSPIQYCADDPLFRNHHQFTDLNFPRSNSSSSRDSQRSITCSRPERTHDSARYRQENSSSSESLQRQIGELGPSSDSVRDLVSRVNAQIATLDILAGGKSYSNACNKIADSQQKYLSKTDAASNFRAEPHCHSQRENPQVNAVLEEMQAIFADLKVA